MLTELRDARLSDYTNIAKLHAESWRKYYRGMYSDKFLDNDVYQNRLDAWNERLSNPKVNQQVIVATRNGNFSGFVCIYIQHDPIFGTLLDNLHVSSEVHKSGIGTLLVKEAAKRSYDADNHSKFYLWVLELNTNARRFYKSLGATEYEIIEKVNLDGSVARACRCIWSSCAELLR